MPKTLTRDDVQNAYMQASSRYADLNNQATVGLMDHSLTKDQYQKIVDDKNQAKMERDGLFEQLQNWDTDHPQNEGAHQTSLKQPANKTLTKEEKLAKINKQINDYAHYGRFLNASDAAPTGDPRQVKTSTVAPTIPEEIIHNPSAEVNSVFDLSTLLTATPVTTSSGTYPVLKRADDRFASVEELKENPDMALPEFSNVRWSIDTKRGALAISQEAIDDSAADVSGIITRQIGERKVNTYNYAISQKLKEFSAASANQDNLVDAYKWLLNVGLDPAYNPTIIVSQSMYNALDTLKDKQGKYIFHQDMTSKSGDTLLGIPVHKVGDTIMGKAGEAKAWIGDLGRALFFPKRLDINLAWQWNQIYGYYLAGVMRFGLSMADAKAGYFLTADIPEQSIVKPKIDTKDNPDEVKKDGTQQDQSH